LCTQRVARVLVEQNLAGSIISVTSIEGVRAAPGFATYAAAKAGVINYTKTAALELAPHGIRVNALAPDITLTEGIMQIAPPGSEQRFGRTIPMGRAGHVDEMAGAAVFLASDMSSYITGQTIHVDGGTQAASGWDDPPATPTSPMWTWLGRTWELTLCSVPGYWSCCAYAAPSWASASPAVNHAS